MKTVFDKQALYVPEGKSVDVVLPEPFRIQDCLFLLVHNSHGETLQVTLSNDYGHSISQNFTLTTFPSILVFSTPPRKEQEDANNEEYSKATFTSFTELDGSLTFRSKNTPQVLRRYLSE